MSACIPTPTSTSRLGLYLPLALLVAGCAATRTTTQLPDLSDWDTRRTVLSAADDWALRGRVGIRTESDGFNAKLRWMQRGRNFDAQVSGPLGIGTVSLQGRGDAVTLIDKDGVRTALEDAEPDLFLRYGWTIPVASLPFWALGIPDPAIDALTEVDEAGRLTRLEQGDWEVLIDRYVDAAGQQLPGRITATSRSTRVRIVVDDWRFFE